eukprot:NODE_8496_length_380_cov_228.910769.p1 GENE.NODE_8496_length_380_cov_228.910769~~NODE_8496_length_380_cov_228.910769.p1  ORF type:complete len:69 (-),score=21.72 NODE_8496_length_380_cov_228.910769:158-337(-)
MVSAKVRQGCSLPCDGLPDASNGCLPSACDEPEEEDRTMNEDMQAFLADLVQENGLLTI